MGQKITALLLAVWLGTQLCSGYIVAPVLFSHLDKMTAGAIAGQIFHIVSYLGIASMLLLLTVLKLSHHTAFFKQVRVKIALAILVLVSINEWLITPIIEALKKHQTHAIDDLLFASLKQSQAIGSSFGIWHGVSSSIFLLVSVLGVVLALMVYALNLGKSRW